MKYIIKFISPMGTSYYVAIRGDKDGLDLTEEFEEAWQFRTEDDAEHVLYKIREKDYFGLEGQGVISTVTIISSPTPDDDDDEDDDNAL